MEMNTFGSNLKELRYKFGYSQDQLAEIFKISKSAISNWEKGKREPDLETIVFLSEFFKVPTDYLLKGRNTSAASGNLEALNLDQKVCFEYITKLSPQTIELAKNYLSLLTKLESESPFPKKWWPVKRYCLWKNWKI